eukprot:54199-Chlamydomonas_euryale.AAC.3
MAAWVHGWHGCMEGALGAWVHGGRAGRMGAWRAHRAHGCMGGAQWVHVCMGAHWVHGAHAAHGMHTDGAELCANLAACCLVAGVCMRGLWSWWRGSWRAREWAVVRGGVVVGMCMHVMWSRWYGSCRGHLHGLWLLWHGCWHVHACAVVVMAVAVAKRDITLAPNPNTRMGTAPLGNSSKGSQVGRTISTCSKPRRPRTMDGDCNLLVAPKVFACANKVSHTAAQLFSPVERAHHNAPCPRIRHSHVAAMSMHVPAYTHGSNAHA